MRKDNRTSLKAVNVVFLSKNHKKEFIVNRCIEDNVILFDYDEGAYGPTIRIDIQSIQSMYLLRDIFLNLSQSKLHEYIINATNLIRLVNIRSIILRSTKNNINSNKVYISRDIPVDSVITWYNTMDGWSNCVDLLDGLIVGGISGHQYLTDENVDSVLIEVAFREKCD